MQNRDRPSAALPEIGRVGIFPREKIIPAARDGDAAREIALAAGRVIHRDVEARHRIAAARGAARVLPEIRAGGEGRLERGAVKRALAVRIIVVREQDHRRAVGVGHRAVLAFVQALIRDEVRVAPHAALRAARELIVQREQIRDARVAKLPEERRVRVAGKCAAALAQRLGLVVAIRVNQADAGAREVERVLEFAARGVVVVMALRVHHRLRGIESETARLIESAQPGAGIAEDVVEIVAQDIVHEPHPGVHIVAVVRRFAEVLAEEHRVVARDLGVENGVAVVRIREAAREIELPLHLPRVAVVVRVLVRAESRAKKIRAHMLHRVEPQPVGLCFVHEPARRAVQIILHILAVKIRIRRERRRRDSVARAKAHIRSVRQVAVIFRVLRIAHKLDFRRGTPLGEPEVFVRRAWLLRDVNEVRETEMLHLPRAAIVARVIPFSVKPILRDPQVKILRHESGVDVHRRALVEARHVERAMIHHIVEIHADTETVCRLDEPQQIRLRAVARAHRAALILRAEIERIKHVVAHAQPAAALRRRRHPDRAIARLREFRHLERDLAPARVEILQQRLRAHRDRAGENQRQQAQQRQMWSSEIHGGSRTHGCTAITRTNCFAPGPVTRGTRARIVCTPFATPSTS